VAWFLVLRRVFSICAAFEHRPSWVVGVAWFFVPGGECALRDFGSVIRALFGGLVQKVSKSRRSAPRAARPRGPAASPCSTVGAMEPSDGALLERWRAGDAAGGEALFEKYYPMVERFFLNKVTSGVADLVQETFIRCVESREKIRDDGRFRSYLFAIAYNVLSAHLRERYRGGGVLDTSAVSVCDLAPGPGTLVARRREHRLLIEALRNIPIDEQVLLELHYWEQLTTEQMAEALAIPVGTVRGRLQRARARLEEAMRHLAESPRDLTSTLERLDEWAAECRQRLDGYRAPP
jgi:RNA polymerase sigma-70 factor (ECF subfamily)